MSGFRSHSFRVPRRVLPLLALVAAVPACPAGCAPRHAPAALPSEARRVLADTAPLADSCRIAAERRDPAASLLAAARRFERVGAVVPPEHPALVAPLVDIGAAHRRCGDFGLAEHYLTEAVHIATRDRGDDRAGRARALHELGLVYKDTSRPDQARRCFDAALADAGAAGPAQAKLAASICGTIGNWEVRFAGADSAIGWYRRSLDLLRDAPPAERAGANTWLGFALLRAGRNDEAARHLRAALALLGPGGRDSPDARSALDLLAMAIGPSGDLREVEDLLRRSTRLADEEAARQPVGFGLSRAHPSIMRGLAEVQLLEGRADEAWETTQVWAGWVTDALLASSAAQSPRAGPPDTTLAALLDVDARLDHAWSDGTGRPRVPAARRLAWLVEAARLEARWIERRGAVRAAPLRRPVLAELRAALAPDEALIGWLDMHWDDDARRGGRHSAWGYVVRRDGPVRWVRLCRWDRERDWLAWRAPLDAYEKQLQSVASWPLRAPADPYLDSLATTLGARVFTPFLPHLDGVRRLVAVYEVLGRMVPLESLRLPDGRELADRYEVAYTPSARTFVTLRRRARAARRGGPRAALVVGDPAFRMEADTSAAAPDTVTDWSDVQQTVLDPMVVRSVLAGEANVAALARLPQARREARAVAATFERSTLLEGTAASEPGIEALRDSGRLAHFDVVHFATHALVDLVHPERSAIALAPGGAAGAPASDGLLRAGELLDDWRLDAGLVTLSSCQTAAGGFTWGAQTLGLAQAMLCAGANGLVLSLWKVDDLATRLLMERFYARMADGATPGEALREARRAVRDYETPSGLRPFANPAYWAGFVLIGDPGPRVARAAAAPGAIARAHR